MKIKKRSHWQQRNIYHLLLFRAFALWVSVTYQILYYVQTITVYHELYHLSDTVCFCDERVDEICRTRLQSTHV